MKKTLLFTAMALLASILIFAEPENSANSSGFANLATPTETENKEGTSNQAQAQVTFDSARLAAETSETESGGEKVTKHYFTAIATMLLDNLVISSWNRFVSRASWAQVTWDDASHFYEHTWIWDNDWYWTNYQISPDQSQVTITYQCIICGSIKTEIKSAEELG